MLCVFVCLFILGKVISQVESAEPSQARWSGVVSLLAAVSGK